MTTRTLALGLALWGVGAVCVRWFGEAVISSERIPLTVATYVTSFTAMAALVPAVCALMRIEKPFWFRAAAFLMLPTLILDAMSLLVFARLYPNMGESNAGLFGGWILMCCAGALVGVWVKQ